MIYSFTFSFILGIIFENFFHFGWSVGVLIFIVSIILSLRLRVWLFFVIGTALFFGILRISLVDVSPDQNFTKFVGQKIYFEAIISHEPDVRDASASYT